MDELDQKQQKISVAVRLVQLGRLSCIGTSQYASYTVLCGYRTELLEAEEDLRGLQHPLTPTNAPHITVTAVQCTALSNLGQSCYESQLFLFTEKHQYKRYDPIKLPKLLGEAKDQIISTSVSTKRANKALAPEIGIVNAASVPMGSCSKT